MNSRVFILAGLAWVSAIVGWTLWQNENILAHGRTVHLELAPVDPRSLLQGDYMALNYAVQNQLRGTQAREDAYVVLQIDERQVGRFLRTQEKTEPIAANEIALRYRVRGRSVKIATNAFFFQEGQEPRYRGAKYGEFRVGSNGEPRLVTLRDANLAPLGDNRF